MVFETMLHVYKMDVVDLGPLNLTEALMETDEGMKACNHYAKVLCEKTSFIARERIGYSIRFADSLAMMEEDAVHQMGKVLSDFQQRSRYKRL